MPTLSRIVANGFKGRQSGYDARSSRRSPNHRMRSLVPGLGQDDVDFKVCGEGAPYSPRACLAEYPTTFVSISDEAANEL